MRNEDLLDIKQAAQLLKVSEVSLRRWTNSGRLPCLRVGGRRERRFRLADLLAFLEVQSGRDGSPVPGGAQESRYALIEGHRVAFGTHLCGLYASDDDRTRLAVAFLSDGLSAGDPCYLVAAPSARTEIVAGLERTISGSSGRRRSRRVVQSSYKKSPRAQYAYYEREFSGAVEAGARRLLLVGNVTDIVPRSPGELVSYEAGFQERIALRFPVVTLCLYDVRLTAGPELLDALRSHPDSLGGPRGRWLT